MNRGDAMPSAPSVSVPPPLRIKEPPAPVGPAVPVAPVLPTAAVPPVGPVTPEPVAPVRPVAPVAPGVPAGPCGPIGPAAEMVKGRNFLEQLVLILTVPLPGFFFLTQA